MSWIGRLEILQCATNGKRMLMKDKPKPAVSDTCMLIQYNKGKPEKSIKGLSGLSFCILIQYPFLIEYRTYEISPLRSVTRHVKIYINPDS